MVLCLLACSWLCLRRLTLHIDNGVAWGSSCITQEHLATTLPIRYQECGPWRHRKLRYDTILKEGRNHLSHALPGIFHLSFSRACSVPLSSKPHSSKKELPCVSIKGMGWCSGPQKSPVGHIHSVSFLMSASVPGALMKILSDNTIVFYLWELLCDDENHVY